MSEPTHTPGPWQKDGSHIYGPDPQRTPVCQIIYPGRGYQEEAAANEAVLLAAPDLLDALKEMVADNENVARESFLGPDDPSLQVAWEREDPTGFAAWQKATAAIAKAEGRS